jgi:multicomponent Na+:H+ antiporter subunit C
MAVAIGVLFAGGTYLMLRPNLIRVVLGMGLYSNAVNLLMIACGGFNPNWEAPFAGEKANKTMLMDPIPPDIILTAIVISFAVGALFLTVAYRVYLDHGTDNPELLPNHEHGDGRDESITIDEPHGPKDEGGHHGH